MHAWRCSSKALRQCLRIPAEVLTNFFPTPCEFFPPSLLQMASPPCVRVCCRCCCLRTLLARRAAFRHSAPL